MNRLQYETSPYLLQHKNNPVDWYPWSEEAFARAKDEDKPVLLSVGYSACHWCHVMEHESFEDPETAALMNEHYISIKVDREERPDVDDIYMQATQSFTGGHGGWPMTVFLTPEGRPFHAGTYFPREPRMGMPSFRQVLLAAADAYHNRREQVDDLADKVTGALQNIGTLNIGGVADVEVNQELLEAAAKKLISRQDRQHGGLHPGQPKFPSPMNLEFLLRYYAQTGDRTYLEPVLFTLQKMAQGGIYDQFGGGFHRYSVDNRWLVPHFEKMLYDNAQLARAYLHAYQVTGEAFYERITREILAYVMREMLDESGGFYSAQDADSEGEEGKFFVWSADEVRLVLADVMTEQETAAFLDLYDITAGGNFEGHNIPNLPEPVDVVARRHNMMPEALRTIAEKGRKALFDVREKRIKPSRDEKTLSAWNGMMLAAFAEAARVLDDDTYRQVAIQNADFLMSELSMDDGRLYRTHKRYADGDGGESKLNGYLEDYANVVDGLLELYQTIFDERWFREARRLTDYVIAHFADKENGGFYDTSDDHEQLIARPRNLQDNATPSGNSLMALNLVRLSAYTGEASYEQAALGTLSQVVAGMREYPSAFGVALSAAYLLVNAPVEVAVVGDPDATEARELLDTIQKPFHPRVITALSTADSRENAEPPLLNSRKMRQDQPTVYVCQNFVCELPVNTKAEVERLLAEA